MFTSRKVMNAHLKSDFYRCVLYQLEVLKIVPMTCNLPDLVIEADFIRLQK